MDFEKYKSLGLDQPTPREMNGRSSEEIAQSLAVPEDSQYNPCPEAYPASDILEGEFKRFQGLGWKYDLSKYKAQCIHLCIK